MLPQNYLVYVTHRHASRSQGWVVWHIIVTCEPLHLPHYEHILSRYPHLVYSLTECRVDSVNDIISQQPLVRIHSELQLPDYTPLTPDDTPLIEEEDIEDSDLGPDFLEEWDAASAAASPFYGNHTSPASPRYSL
ncbi:hypothetical protein GOP47_0028081 [Adiantum capillus-veneris]|nr:hypothetical protein GOP47_0028081 [Adiantum capillus-veneris]